MIKMEYVSHVMKTVKAVLAQILKLGKMAVQNATKSRMMHLDIV